MKPDVNLDQLKHALERLNAEADQAGKAFRTMVIRRIDNDPLLLPDFKRAAQKPYWRMREKW